ncbi:TRAP transporter large permease subunit [Chloroflexota bacterium]
MSVELLSITMFGAFFVLLAVGVPLAWSTLILAIFFGYLIGGSSTFPLLLHRTWTIMASFSLMAIPLFVFMANMLQHSGIAESLFDAVHRWMGPVRGGLAIATVVVCTVLAAMVGTVGAGVTIMGLIALPAMLKHHYHKDIALGSIVAGGGLGIMIPPSVSFIMYGVVAGMSIGKLFMGGVGPGLLLASLYIVYIGVRSYLSPNIAPALPPKERAITLVEKLALTKSLILPILLICGVLGSIYLGVATPSEAAGVGALGAMICSAIRRELTWTNLKQALYGTMKTVGLMMWIVFGAFAFIGIFIIGGGEQYISQLLAGLPFGRWGILAIIMLMLLVLGMVMDVVGIIILTVPIFVPLTRELGFDPLWFAIIYNVNLQIAFLSPPFGYGMFYLKGVTPPEISMTDIYRSCLPFMGLQIIALILVIVFPPIATWLPNQMIR